MHVILEEDVGREAEHCHDLLSLVFNTIAKT